MEDNSPSIKQKEIYKAIEQLESLRESTQLEAVERSLRALESMDELRSLRDTMVHEKRVKCLEAFGHDGFCSCLASKLPVILGLDGYVKIVTLKREDLDYDNLSEDDKKIVDTAYDARNQCVSATFTEEIITPGTAVN